MLVVVVLLSGCRTNKSVVSPIHDTIEVSRVKYDSVYIDRFREVTKTVDTVWQKDSVVTVRWRVTSDTVEKVREVPVTVERVVEVERELSVWQRLLMWMGYGMLAVVAGGIILLIWQRKSR